jgi:DNA polymerase-3 subunit gamma/tau
MPETTQSSEVVPAVVDGRPREYQVVARRYRPQTFADLIGQEHVGRSLANAITSQRVGHAYLFTGARGVGKTSTARILAKALNCVTGPTPSPCNKCDICESISAGEDVDVLEIDGASNRGIDEIRELRQNVNIRPSRSRFKIYIIDEVHMLTRDAFNALLKTLEEPPEHVKFIFCTTEADKIPITVLSRCQRFDFAGIQSESIARRLEQIVATEGVTAEPEALALLARRAAGSMRDSQSLLEQLLAFGERHITVADVHAMLGTAGDQLLSGLVSKIVARDSAGALAELDRAVQEGVDASQLLEQLLGYFRDMMVVAVGCPSDACLHISPAEQPQIAETAQRWGLETILAGLQIIDQTLSRLRFSTQPRTLAELALVRLAKLEDLEELPRIIGQLRQGLPAVPSASVPAAPRTGVPLAESKKKAGDFQPAKQVSLGRGVSVSSDASPQDGSQTETNDTVSASVSPADELQADTTAAVEITPSNVRAIWDQALAEMGDMLARQAACCDSIAIPAPNWLVVRFAEKYTSFKTSCERPEHLARLEQSLYRVSGNRVRIEFALVEKAPGESVEQPAPQRGRGSAQQLAEKSQHPLVRRAAELFGAEPVWVDESQS